MLSEVTDKDTDLITKNVIEMLTSNSYQEKTSDLALLVSQARSSCNWYLNASALAVYGLPLYLTPASLGE